MKRIYRLLVILMGLMFFIGAYVVIKQDRFSNLDQLEVPSDSQSKDN